LKGAAMHKYLLSEFRLQMTLAIPSGGHLLVAEGERAEVRGEDGEKRELTVHVRQNGRAYLPGSSLKGVLRNAAERIARLLGAPGPGCCHPFDRPPRDRTAALSERLFCGDRFAIRSARTAFSTPDVYRQACPICRLFGHTYERGRLSLSDFHLVGSSKFETIRQKHVAIDRITGGAASGKLYEVEPLVESIFVGDLVVQNFSLWQLGLLSMLFQDLEDGLIRLGHHQKRGAGRLTWTEGQASLRYLGSPPNGEIWGLSQIVGDTETLRPYGLSQKDVAAAAGLTWERNIQWSQANLAEKSAIVATLLSCRQPTVDIFAAFQFEEAMKISALQALRQPSHEPIAEEWS